MAQRDQMKQEVADFLAKAQQKEIEA